MRPRFGLGGRLVPLALAASVVAATPAAAFTDEEKKELGPIIREYIITHPEVLEEAITVLEARHNEAQAEQRTKALEQVRELVLTSPHNVVIGNPKGDVTLVEFFDYNCGYCRKAMVDLKQLMKNDPNLRVVLREFPVLGQASVEAAQVAIALHMVAPDKYLAFHEALFNTPGPIDREKALAAAESVGVNVEELEKKASSPELNASLDETMKIASVLGLNGTPSYIVGDQVVVGAVGHDKLKAAIAATRAQKKAAQ
ncbi:DsbA family protein [Xanthobacter sp. TB0139]|uniref:DsbA family protein n=1 Tax=Xanthobacter sp. TB0139 TaxID=3459178 RepID=UPI00403A16F1